MPPAPCGPEPWGAAGKSWATLHPIARSPMFWMESRGWCMKRQSQKGKPYLPSASACTLTSVWCPRAMGTFLFLCLLPSPPLPVLQGLRNGFYNFHLLKTQWLLHPVPCSSPRLFLVPGRNYRRKPCFPHPGNFQCAAGHCPPPSPLPDSAIFSPLSSKVDGRGTTRPSVPFWAEKSA